MYKKEKTPRRSLIKSQVQSTQYNTNNQLFFNSSTITLGLPGVARLYTLKTLLD